MCFNILSDVLFEKKKERRYYCQCFADLVSDLGVSGTVESKVTNNVDNNETKIQDFHIMAFLWMFPLCSKAEQK